MGFSELSQLGNNRQESQIEGYSDKVKATVAGEQWDDYSINELMAEAKALMTGANGVTSSGNDLMVVVESVVEVDRLCLAARNVLSGDLTTRKQRTEDERNHLNNRQKRTGFQVVESFEKGDHAGVYYHAQSWLKLATALWHNENKAKLND